MNKKCFSPLLSFLTMNMNLRLTDYSVFIKLYSPCKYLRVKRSRHASSPYNMFNSSDEIWAFLHVYMRALLITFSIHLMKFGLFYMSKCDFFTNFSPFWGFTEKLSIKQDDHDSYSAFLPVSVHPT